MSTTLAPVIGDNPRLVADWKARILPSDDPSSLFHTKFWGIKDEGLLSLSDSMGEHEDDHDTEVDASTTQGDGSDIIKDCYESMVAMSCYHGSTRNL